MTKNITPRELESISAYLDGQLSAKERARLEGRLQANENLRAILDDLRRTRTLLRLQPKLRAPRNFTLTRAMVGERSRKTAGFNFFPALRLASVVASFAFVAVILGELLLGGQPAASPLIAAQAPAPKALEMQSEAAPAAKLAPDAAASDQPMGTEAVALLEATQETPPDFPVDIPPQTFSEEPPTGPRQAGGGGGAPGLGGGDGSTPVEEPLPEVLEGTPLPEDALAFSTVMTPSETLAAPTETLLAAPTEAALAAAPALGESQELAAQEEAPVAAPAQGWSTWRWVEAALAIIALVAGGLAFYLRRQGRA